MVTLQITAEGNRAVAAARSETQKSLTGVLLDLDGQELHAVTRSMGILRRAFTKERVNGDS